MKNTSRRVCAQGHAYFKSSDCPTCPICEAQKKPKNGFLAQFAAPARRALESNKILSVKDAAQYTEEGICALHGIGPKALEIIAREMKKEGLSIRKVNSR